MCANVLIPLLYNCCCVFSTCVFLLNTLLSDAFSFVLFAPTFHTNMLLVFCRTDGGDSCFWRIWFFFKATRSEDRSVGDCYNHEKVLKLDGRYTFVQGMLRTSCLLSLLIHRKLCIFGISLSEIGYMWGYHTHNHVLAPSHLLYVYTDLYPCLLSRLTSSYRPDCVTEVDISTP